MSKRFFIWALAMLLLCGCATLKDAGQAYFRQGDKVKGVEPADALMKRMKQDQELRKIVYGELKAAKMVQCTLLRNQLYVASMQGKANKEVMEAVKLMETAYQDNDAEFLQACEQVLSTELGRIFLAVQQEYLIDYERQEH